MNPFVLFVPALVFILWALWVLFCKHRFVDMGLLLMLLLVSGINEILVYRMMSADLSTGLHMLQMGACSCILPLLYMLLSRQVSPQQYNLSAMVWLWGLALCSFIPNIVVYNPFEPLVIPESGLKPFAFYVFSHGEKLFGIYCGDLMVILQAVVLLVLIVLFVREIRSIGLHINKQVFIFLGISLGLVIVAILLSSMNYAALRDPKGEWFYFGVYALISVMVNSFFAMGYDLSLVQTQSGETVPDVEEYAQKQYEELAARFRCLMEKEHLYQDATITAERATELLETNRTYFARMMSTVLKMSFSDYLNELRLRRVEELLRDESVSISMVAEQSGFADSGYMARRFKAKYGCTPTDWRKSTISTDKSEEEPV